MPRFVAALSIALVCALAAPSLAHADDDAPAPKKVRIKLKKGPAAPAPRAQKSPMSVVEAWLMQKLGETMTTSQADPLQGMLEQWFEGDEDVPVADLRDALKAEGWNANSMRTWMMGKMLRLGARLPSAHSAPRTFTWFDGDGMREHGMRGHAPQWGARRGFGRRGGMRPWMHRRGMHRRGMQGPRGQRPPMQGPRQQRRPRHGFTHGGQPRVHTQQRAYVIWHDGTRWHQQELSPGMSGPFGRTGPGGGQPPFGGMAGPQGARRFHMFTPGMPGRPGGPGAAGQQGGMGRRAPAPPAAPGQAPQGLGGGLPIQGLEQLEELMKGLLGDEGALDLDGASLQQLQKLLEQLHAPAGALPPSDGKIKVRVVPPQPPRKVKRKSGLVKLHPAPDTDTDR